MIVIGLTGSVGMGKSTTAALFAEAGVPVFDADAVVHALYSAGPAVAAVEAAFPGVTRDGCIDREALATRVVGDAPAMRRLEAIVHPLVHAARTDFLRARRVEGAPLVVLDIPLLFETENTEGIDKVVVASAPAPVQKMRVLGRPGMTEPRFAAILAKQMPDAEKRRRADYIINTGEGLDAARQQVRAVIAALRPA